jgi:hypothetical protein
VLERRVRVSLIPSRVVLVFGVFLALAALLLGILLPPGTAGSPDILSTGPPQLVVSEYADASSTIWLVDPADPAARVSLLPVPHASGWAVEGAVSPAGDRVALLVLPPGGRNPTSDTQLLISDGGPARLLAAGIDLRGGLVWAADGAQIFARRTETRDNGAQAFFVLAIDPDDGSERVVARRAGVAGLYPAGRPRGGPTYVVSIGPGGSRLLTADSAITERSLAAVVTRDWTISPDGTELAFTEQRGLELRVVVAALRGPARLHTAQDIGDAEASASPAWRHDGSLSIGRFGSASGLAAASAAGSGFDLPVAWSPDGNHLALRAFSGPGPGTPGAEVVAIRSATGKTTTIGGDHVRILGWWNGAD